MDLLFFGKHSFTVLLLHGVERKTIFLTAKIDSKTAGPVILAMRTAFAVMGTIVVVGVKEKLMQMIKYRKEKKLNVGGEKT